MKKSEIQELRDRVAELEAEARANRLVKNVIGVTMLIVIIAAWWLL